MTTGGGGVGGGGGGGGGAMDRRRWAESKVYTRKSFKGLKPHISEENTQTLPSHELNSSAKDHNFGSLDVASDDSSSLNRLQNMNTAHGGGDKQSVNGMGGGLAFLRAQNRVSVNVALKTKKERRDLRRKLEGELILVRNLAKKIEKSSNAGVESGKLKRVHSEVGSVGGLEFVKQLEPLSIPMAENSLGASDNVEKEKRTPKANPFYQSSDFILGKDKISHVEQNKKSKAQGKKNGESGAGMPMGNSSSKIFKSCSSLLERLMKHKHGWVFDKPVDVKGLGLHDYHTIIKHPMDLGTVKSRLNTNWYKSPKEFGEDVRLTFHNAMSYNPKGHDVHVMAEQLFKMFEDKWMGIETEFLGEVRTAGYEAGLPTPTSRKTAPPPPLPPAIDTTRTLDKSESMTNPAGTIPKNANPAASGRTPAPKKPKAKDPHKRDMTYEEKQKLSTHLQNLPSEKLDNIVQIIRKRNPSLCQNDDEIEVDIDNVDTETLWELDRFVTNYRKNLSKVKRRAELAQGRTDTEPKIQVKDKAMFTTEESKEGKKEDKSTVSSPPVQAEKQEVDATKSNSSSSSGSDSGSSSSESDSDSSST